MNHRKPLSTSASRWQRIHRRAAEFGWHGESMKDLRILATGFLRGNRGDHAWKNLAKLLIDEIDKYENE